RRMQIGECEIFATNAPLLPKQLQRIAQLSNAPFSIAFSTGNRLTAQKNAQPLVVKAATEGALIKIIDALRSKS
ncbi:P1 family peptidase, partial [bacterium]|nr:P1 family peptidase [bacterium]